MSAHERSDIALTETIRAIYLRSRETYGSPNIHAELADDHKIRVGRKRVARLMRIAGLRGATLRKFVADFADLTRSPKPEEFLPLELNAFVESVRSSAEPHARNSQIEVEAAPAPGEIWVRGDRYLLERAALNLVYNAIEASPAGSRVRISAKSENGRALLTVEDRGAGIARDRLETLFDSFTSTKRTGAHVGMGLPNVRRIALAHGGDISVKSKPGDGAVFTLDLPAAHSSSFSS